MTGTGIILYGPPASGKSTITDLLEARGIGTLFKKLKVGTGRSDGYRLTTMEQVVELRRQGQVVYENERYGNLYTIDRPALDDMLSTGHIPIVHMGQVTGVRALKRYPANWHSVCLWCSRDTMRARAAERATGDYDHRLTVWEQTVSDIASATAYDFAFQIDTDLVTPPKAVDIIHRLVIGEHVTSMGHGIDSLASTVGCGLPEQTGWSQNEPKF